MPAIENPILPGFNPDPSIVRVGGDYYIATSTFEWFPGVQIHHSRDLANWTLVSRPLDRKSQLDMRGNPDSCGIWAPCLSYAGGLFWLVYTDVKRKDGSFKDAHNYVVTAPSIEGPWSDPVYLNSSGFDPSLFHDEDGKKWLVNMVWDHRARPNLFAGIALQQYDPRAEKLVGERRIIFYGTELGLVEGPHLYRRTGKDGQDFYYLLTAEGGTGYTHACTFARAKSIEGPYELHPETHILTSKDAPDAPLQRAGHGDIVDTPEGKTYLVHLSGRPITDARRCVLGRETAIQEAFWGEDDWLYVKGGLVPSLSVEVPGTFDRKAFWSPKTYRFSADEPLHIDFQWLRTPEPDRIFSLSEAPGKLRLFGRESIGSWFEQALVARRQTHFDYEAETELAFCPDDEREMAGLIAYYGRFGFHYLAVSADSEGNRNIEVMSSIISYPDGRLTFPGEPVALPQTGKVRLKARVEDARLQFFHAVEDGIYQPIGPVLDASILSDECGANGVHGSFTGAFIGMAAHDLNGGGKAADFSHFAYRPLNPRQ